MSITSWPGADRRNPRRSSSTWVVRSALLRWLESQVAELRPRAPLRILDVGCGVKPYYPLFAAIAAEYVGVDVVETEWADVVGPAEALPVGDASFDLVLCTQVLEHTDDPAQTVRELRRVLAPGGRLLASTHGVQWYHPSPNDYWRWTHTGLSLLFERHADWSSLSVSPAVGSGSTLAMLLANYAEAALHRTVVSRGVVSLLHRMGAGLDAAVPRMRELRPGSLIANYHVVADAAPQREPQSPAGQL